MRTSLVVPGFKSCRAGLRGGLRAAVAAALLLACGTGCEEDPFLATAAGNEFGETDPGRVAAMGDSFGSSPADLLAGIGPAIGPCCFEVGPDIAAMFSRMPETAGCVRHTERGRMVDLPVAEIKMTLSEWYETVYKNRISEDQLTQIMRPGIPECPQVIAGEAVVISCPSY